MKWVLYLLTVVLIVIHQDFWNWNSVNPLLFGFMPVGIWYHALYCILAALLLWGFVQFAWPTELENVQPEPGVVAQRDPSHGH
jgi:amino acid transporter